MIFVEFPITDKILRFPMLLMEGIFTFTCLELSLIFLLRYKKQEKELRNLQELGYFSLALGFALMSFFYIISDYYSPAEIISPFFIWNQGSVRLLFLNFGYFSITAGVTFFVLCLEKYKVYLFKKYLFSVLVSIYTIVFLIMFFIDIRITQSITYLFGPLFALFLCIYLINFIIIVQNKKKLLIGLLKLLPGYAFLLIGFFLTTDVVISYSLVFRLFGVSFELIGMVFLSYFYLTLPPFSEFDWQEKIEVLFLINEAGNCLYYKTFKEKKNLMDQNLISAAISGVDILLNELMDSKESDKKISVIKKKGKTVVICPGKFVHGVLYTSEDLNIVKVVLKEFVQKFETLYYNILLKWNGDTAIFIPVENIADELFCK